MSLDQEAITQQLELLAAHRRMLAVYLRQQAELGVLAPPGVVNGIAEARAEIGRVKVALREGGMVVEDELNDEGPLATELPTPPVATSGAVFNQPNWTVRDVYNVAGSLTNNYYQPTTTPLDRQQQ